MSRTLFLSPHNDDETLFGAFTLLRERPRIVTCFRGEVQRLRGAPITAEDRMSETRAALAALFVGDSPPEWIQLPFSDATPEWPALKARLRDMVLVDRIYAPAYETEGHDQHNGVATLAEELWPGKVTHYLTYTTRGKSFSPHRVPATGDFLRRKLLALGCYRSQINHPSTREHFIRDQYEYYTAPEQGALP